MKKVRGYGAASGFVGEPYHDFQVDPKCPDCNGPMRLRDGRYGRFYACIKHPYRHRKRKVQATGVANTAAQQVESIPAHRRVTQPAEASLHDSRHVNEIACPNCGSTNISFDWDVAATVGFRGGVAQYVEFAGFDRSRPDRIFCPDCDMDSMDLFPGTRAGEPAPDAATIELAEKAQSVAEAASTAIPEEYTHEVRAYERPTIR
jgi:ssDNA-binding Zn-finger/Zn-ribbon topoisomerase 1